MMNKKQEDTLEPVQQNILIPITSLYGHKRNYRQHPPEQIKKLKASLERWGQVRSIVAQANSDGTYTIVAGHGLVQAAQELVNTNTSYYERFGKMRVDVIPASWSSEQVSGYLVADNNLSVDAVDDDEILVALLQEQSDAGFDLASLGTDDETLRQMLKALGDEYAGGGREEGNGGDEFDTTPQEGPTRTRVGEIWQLGKHRLMVGDSTKQEDVHKLMRDDKATLVVTSPPYWVGREYEQEHSKEEITAHIETSAKIMASVTADLSHIAINTGTTTETKHGGNIRRIWLLLDWWSNAFEKHGWYMRNVRIWAKHGGFTTFTPHQDVVDQNWEFLASFTHAKPKPQNAIGERWALDGIWDCQPQVKDVGHSAPFPLEIPTRYIDLYTDEHDIVFEPYCGSGTTLIACERINRICRGMELDPKYADVILKRWEAETGQTATLLERVEEVANA